MGMASARWKEKWRRYGPAGFVAKAALKASEGALGLSLEAHYTAALDSVVAALHGVDTDDELRIDVLKGRKKRPSLHARMKRLHSALSAQDLADFDRIALAEKGDELVGYWCFSLRDAHLHERGVVVGESVRGQGVAARLLLATIRSLQMDLEHSRLLATSDLFNRSSRRMLERCGLQLDGVMSQGRLPLMGHFHIFWKPSG